ncbi:MAG: AAA family ATPase [Candidatus Omnitrophota bacterium]
MVKKIFIAATRQNDGKTTVALGLIRALKRKYPRIGFIKPVGQRYLIEEGYKVDEDSVLIDKTANVKCRLKDMSPIAVEKGFTEKYILRPEPDKLVKNIEASYKKVAKNKDLVIIEGTGHAGVGSVFDLSNARVAKVLGAKIILISSGGIGRPIDEIMLNMSLFIKEEVEVLGVIINKVHRKKFKKVNRLVRLGLKRKGIKVLGVMPYYPVLHKPTIAQILQETNARLLHGRIHLEHMISRVIVAAMMPHEALEYIEENSLVITPGDRADIILSIITAHLLGKNKGGVRIAGIILTGGIIPHHTVMRLLKKTNVPVLLLTQDTYTVASKIHDLTIKIRPADEEKTKTIIKMVKNYVDVREIVRQIE